MAGIAISYNSNSLQTSNIITGQIDGIDQHPAVDVKQYILAHANLSKTPFTSYPNRTITLTGKLFNGSFATLDSNIDTFKSYLVGTDQNLDIGYNSGTRRFIATVNKVTVQRPNNLGWASFSIEFICNNPFGMDTSTTTLESASGRTSSSYADSITVAGTAPYQLPVITVTATTVGGSPVAGTISVGNNSTGQQINVTRTWTSADVLVIDSTQNTVTVNGVATDFSGAFPWFAIGAGTLGYADSFASRTFNYSVVYTKLYL